MDAVLITTLILSIGSCLVSIATHIKHSKCFCIDIETRTPLLNKNVSLT